MEPLTRTELFLAKAAGQDVALPEPVTRVEKFLAALIKYIASIGGDSSQNANIYIGNTQPTDGTLYWLDTSDVDKSTSDDSGSEEEPEIITYSVTATLTAVTSDNAAASVDEGGSYGASLTANDGYELSSVSVTMGGEDITSAVYSNGTIYIASVTGDIVITAVATEIVEDAVTYTITNSLVNVTSNNSVLSVEENAEYTATLTIADGCELSSYSVTMGGVDITADVYADGVITIPAVTGDIVITAVAAKPSDNLVASNIFYEEADDGTLGADTSYISRDTYEAVTSEKLYYVTYCDSSLNHQMTIFFGYNKWTTGTAVVTIGTANASALTADGTYVTNITVTSNDSYACVVVYEIDMAALLNEVTWQELVDAGTIVESKGFAIRMTATMGNEAKILYSFDPEQPI